MFVIGRQAISISTPPKLMGHMATFALVVSFGTAAAPGAATYRGETTIWEVREGQKFNPLQLLVPLVVATPPQQQPERQQQQQQQQHNNDETFVLHWRVAEGSHPVCFFNFFPGVGRVEGQIHLGKRNKLIDSQVPAVKEYGLVPRKVSAWTDNVCELHTNPAQSVNQSDTQKSCPIMMSPKCESSKKTKTKMQTKSGIRWKHSAY